MDSLIIYQIKASSYTCAVSNESHHDNEVAPLRLVVRLLEYGLEEEGVLGEALHGTDQDVQKAEAVAVLLGLAPLKESRGNALTSLAYYSDFYLYSVKSVSF